MTATRPSVSGPYHRLRSTAGPARLVQPTSPYPAGLLAKSLLSESDSPFEFETPCQRRPWTAAIGKAGRHRLSSRRRFVTGLVCLK